MKREAMKWMKEASECGTNARAATQDVLAELKRLRRIERAAKKAVSMQTAEGLDAALGELAAALKNGGRK